MFLLPSGNESSLKKVHAIIIIFKCSWTLAGPTLIWPGALSLSVNPEESQPDSGTWTNRVCVSLAGITRPRVNQDAVRRSSAEPVYTRGSPVHPRPQS